MCVVVPGASTQINTCAAEIARDRGGYGFGVIPRGPQRVPCITSPPCASAIPRRTSAYRRPISQNQCERLESVDIAPIT
ncbi:hypothetical protein SKAU_G00379690 [Synaphobranchus kaupii]|uniref:Uncharacterized protein n=1 Tax=Synaphobranchus kaupii TaxID=118154 RepID=A0A9Q1IEK1_SYNKA|nr:hypothetical protein SKAU_G00379690 [Synaphobranchus kaupii]